MVQTNTSAYLIAIAEKDDQQAFKKLYQHFLPRLLSYANTFLNHKQLSEEVVEDVFIKIWSNRKTLPAITNFSYYLYTATKHTAINYFRSRKRAAFDSLADTEEIIYLHNPESGTIQKENLRQIEAAINELPEKCRLIFRLIKEEGLKYKEVAQLLSISPKTVEAHMTLAYNRLAECLEGMLSDFTGIKKAAGL